MVQDFQALDLFALLSNQTNACPWTPLSQLSKLIAQRNPQQTPKTECDAGLSEIGTMIYPDIPPKWQYQHISTYINNRIIIMTLELWGYHIYVHANPTKTARPEMLKCRLNHHSEQMNIFETTCHQLANYWKQKQPSVLTLTGKPGYFAHPIHYKRCFFSISFQWAYFAT